MTLHCLETHVKRQVETGTKDKGKIDWDTSYSKDFIFKACKGVELGCSRRALGGEAVRSCYAISDGNKTSSSTLISAKLHLV